MAKCIEDFEEIDIEACGICLSENDQQFGCNIDWIQCQFCDMWFHQSCIDCHDFDFDNFTFYYCIID